MKNPSFNPEWDQPRSSADGEDGEEPEGEGRAEEEGEEEAAAAAVFQPERRHGEDGTFIC